MQKIKSLSLIATLALISVPVGKLIWPPAHDLPFPNNTQLAFFIILATFEGVALVYGTGFLIRTLQLIKKLPQMERKRYTIMALAIAWSLINWWLHDNMHMHNGTEIVGLLMIEYGFHVTLIASAVILAYNFVKLLEEKLPK